VVLSNKSENYFHKRLKERIETFKPDYIGFSVMIDDYVWACDVAKYIKENYPKIPIVFGGIHVTSCTEEVIKNDFVDYAVIGEAEEAIVELVENPKKTNIKNVWSKKNGKIYRNPQRPLEENLDKLPLPDKTLFEKEAPYLSDVYYIITSRGCPFHCTYCFNNFMMKFYKGSQWLRKRSVENVMEELRIMKKKNLYKMVIFGDDCLTFDVKWLKEFFEKYDKEIGLPFKAIVHSVFMNDEVASILKKSGCIRIELGVQTPVERVRKEICKRTDTNSIIANAMKAVRKQGIMSQIDHIFGLPTEDIEEYKKNLDFYIDLKPSYISVFWLSYLPNTEIIEIGKKYGEVDDKIIQDTIKGIFRSLDSMNKRKEDPEIRAMVRFFLWIPVLPRPLSRYLVRKNLYQKLFKIDKLNILPYILVHLKSIESIKSVYRSIKRRREMIQYYQRLDKKYKDL